MYDLQVNNTYNAEMYNKMLKLYNIKDGQIKHLWYKIMNLEFQHDKILRLSSIGII